jgi:hypothetical protein
VEARSGGVGLGGLTSTSGVTSTTSTTRGMSVIRDVIDRVKHSVGGWAVLATTPPQSVVTYTITVVAEEVGGYKNVSKGIANVVRALQASTVGVNGNFAPFVVNLRKAASVVKTYGLSQITSTSVRVVKVGAPVVVRSTAPTLAPTAVPSTANVVNEMAKQQFLWTLPQMGFVWFPITIFFGGLCFLLPCCYCCGGWSAVRTVKKACVCSKGTPALDEEEFGAKYRAGRSGLGLSGGFGGGLGGGLGFKPTDPNDLEKSISISGLQEQAAKKSLFLLKGNGSPNRGKYSLVGQRDKRAASDEEEKM